MRFDITGLVIVCSLLMIAYSIYEYRSDPDLYSKSLYEQDKPDQTNDFYAP